MKYQFTKEFKKKVENGIVKTISFILISALLALGLIILYTIVKPIL